MKKLVKGIGLFFVYPMVVFGLGLFCGVALMRFFYPGEQALLRKGQAQQLEARMEQQIEQSAEPESLEVLSEGETLCVDTEYVLEETDILRHTAVETSWRLPDKYVGMNREQFLEAMDRYAAFPPLSEQERGFVGLEVKSFSRERVVVQMNYRYVQPSLSFYLVAYDNEVLVYLDDLETVYIETHIRLDSLPEELQKKIIYKMWLEDEEALYDFLENYSS